MVGANKKFVGSKMRHYMLSHKFISSFSLKNLGDPHPTSFFFLGVNSLNLFEKWGNKFWRNKAQSLIVNPNIFFKTRIHHFNYIYYLLNSYPQFVEGIHILSFHIMIYRFFLSQDIKKINFKWFRINPNFCK